MGNDRFEIIADMLCFRSQLHMHRAVPGIVIKLFKPLQLENIEPDQTNKQEHAEAEPSGKFGGDAVFDLAHRVPLICLPHFRGGPRKEYCRALFEECNGERPQKGLLVKMRLFFADLLFVRLARAR